MKSELKTKSSHYDAVVVGAGVIGLSLAIGLAKQNTWKVALIEKRTSPENTIK